jgi:GNAT superfamily N-acetyltransferase
MRTDRTSTRKLRRWKEADAGWFRELDNTCFPTDISFYNTANYHWWVIRDSTGSPVAYAGLRIENCLSGRIAHFTRCGVLPGSRGRGFQRTLIEARLRWCAKTGIQTVKTYTSHDNTQSAANLKACGFRCRRTKGWLRFRKDLT